MSLDPDSQQWLSETNGKNMPRLSPLYKEAMSEHEEEKLDLRQIMTVVRRRAIVLTGVAIAVTSGVVAKILSEVPQYEGKFQLLVEPIIGKDKSNASNNQIDASLITGIQATPSLDYETQLKVLWSRQVMSPIADQIKTQYPDLDYGTFLSKLSISRLGTTKILEVRYQDSDPEKIQFILQLVSQAYVKYSLKDQQTTLRQGIQFVDKQLPALQGRVDKLQEKLQRFRQYYNLIEPEAQGQTISNRLNAITQEAIETQTKLGETQSLYIMLQRQLGLSPTGAMIATSLSESPRYQKLLSSLQEIETKIAIESVRFQPDSPPLQTLQAQRQNILPLLQQEAQRILGNNTPSIGIQQTLASPSTIRSELTKQLVESANQIKILDVRRQSLSQAENFVSQQLKQMAVIARQYTDLQRELKVATESLNRFLGVRENLEIQSAQNTIPWQLILEPQKQNLPISPNVPRSLILGMVAGVLAGAGAALLAEKLDNVFHSAEELRDAARMPVLGTIPFKKELKGYVGNISDITGKKIPTLDLNNPRPSNYSYNASPFSEAFRSLHANLHFLSPDRPIRSMTISSSVPADGKSTVAVELAHAAAAMGQRVLLVDADLRRPQIHLMVDLPNVWGLSNVISTDLNTDDVIQRSPLDDNLFVLTAGQIPPDPTKLLSSQKMQSLITRFNATFDLVIFDTPPLLGLADCRLLTAYTDGLLLVVGLGRTNRPVLTQVLDGLKTSRALVLGIVANGVKNYTTNSYDYYQDYYRKNISNQPTLDEEMRDSF